MNEKDKTQLGKILLKQKLVKPDELESLLDEQQIDHKRLASKALEKGLVDEVKLLKALSEQHGIPATNLDEVEINLSVLDIVPQDIAFKHVILPVSMDGDSIHLAMASPEDKRVVDEIEFVSGKRVFPHVALHDQLTVAIEKCYSSRSGGESLYRGKRFGQSVQPMALNEAVLEPIEPGTEGAVIADVSKEDDFGDFGMEVDVPIDELSTPQPFPEEFSEQRISDIAAENIASGRKILVVDDEDDIRLLISRVLTDKGYRVVTAARGLEAIQKVQTENPEMIILDAMLPEVHGFDICKKIKGSSKYGHIPVIMISAIYRGWRYAQDLKDSYGVDDFIEKPFKIGELIEKVEKHSRASKADSASDNEALSKEAERTLSAGIDAYRTGRLDEAIDLLKKGISIDPLAFKLHYHLALLLGKKGLNYQAIRALENALELAPDYFPALKNLAVLYQKAGFKFKAIETWERAIGYCQDEKTREGIKQHLMGLL
jgi:DNA-binding response OmpR family regulator